MDFTWVFYFPAEVNKVVPAEILALHSHKIFYLKEQ